MIASKPCTQAGVTWHTFTAVDAREKHRRIDSVERSRKSMTRGNIPENDDSVTDVAMVPEVHGNVEKIESARKSLTRRTRNSFAHHLHQTTVQSTDPACAFHLHPRTRKALGYSRSQFVLHCAASVAASMWDLECAQQHPVDQTSMHPSTLF